MADHGRTPPADDDGTLDTVEVGARMSEQFIELLGLWTEQLTTLADVGIDPTPLVKSLAAMLRSAADQLDAAAPGA